MGLSFDVKVFDDFYNNHLGLESAIIVQVSDST